MRRALFSLLCSSLVVGGCSSASPSSSPSEIVATPPAPGCVEGESACERHEDHEVTQEQRDRAEAVAMAIENIETYAGLAPDLAVDARALTLRLTDEIFRADPSPTAFYRALRQVSLAYPIGHMSLIVPEACGTLDHPYASVSRLGACAQPYRDHAVVSFAAPANPLGLRAGDEITAVDGKAGAAMMDASLAQPLCGSSSASESNRRFVAATSLFAAAKAGMQVSIRHPDGTTETKVVDRTAREIACDDPFARPSDKLASSTMRADGIGVIRVTSFYLADLQQTLPFEELLRRIRQEIQDAFDAVKSAPGLVWDLRANAGGSTYNGLEIVSGTAGARTGTEIGAYRMRTGGLSYTEREPFVLAPSTAFAYAGKVAFVTDGLTISAADYAARAAKLASDVILVGAPTAGAYGGGGAGADIGANVPVSLSPDPYRGEDTAGRPLEGAATEPAVPVELEPHDLARGIDTVIETAAALVRP